MRFFNANFFGAPKKEKFSEKDKLKLALEYSSIGVWEYEAEQDRVFFSEGSKQIIGVTNSDFGKNPDDWNDRVHEEDKTKYFQDFQDHVNGLIEMYDNIHRIKCEDGSYKWIRDRGKVVEWMPDGSYKRIIGTHTDITALKDAEEKTKIALQIASKQNNKLKSFAHIVTHNLRQHTGNLENLLEFFKEAENDQEKEEIFNHLVSLSSSLTTTIKNLNHIVSVQSHKHKNVEKIYIATEIDKTLELLDLVIKKSSTTIINNIPRKLFIYYNPSYFESIIQNLLTNAIKYKHPDRDPVVTLDCTFDYEKIELRVTDNGIGIDLDKFGKEIFGLYKTFHNNDNAEGVGLYLIKNQIENFGGAISIQSEIGKGTTFTIVATNKKSTHYYQ